MVIGHEITHSLDDKGINHTKLFVNVFFVQIVCLFSCMSFGMSCLLA